MSSGDASRPRVAYWLTGALLLSTLPFLLTLAFGPKSGMEAMVILIPWLGMLVAHGVLGPLSLLEARAERRSVLLPCLGVYLAVFAGVHALIWARANEVPQQLELRTLAWTQPADHALFELATQHRRDPEGLAERVRALAEQGADLDRVGPFGLTALYRAAGHDLPFSLALLEAGADPSQRTREGAAPLHIAIRQGEVEIALALLAHGADPDAAAPDGTRPLCRVITSRGAAGELSDDGMRVLQALLAADADPGACGALSLAAGLRQAATLRALTAAGHRGTPAEAGRLSDLLVQAVRGRDTQWAALLLSAGADAGPALSLAVEHRREELVRVLLEAGADARAEPYLVATAGSPEADAITDLLLAHGADPDVADAKGRTPLVQAARAAHDENVRRLVALGADPDHVYDDEPLVLSLQTLIPKRKHVTALLLELGADPNAHGREGTTPLMRATRNSHHELMRALLDAGADVNAVDDARRTALHHAAVTRFEALVGLEILVAAGARLEATDAQGHTPLCTAQADGNVPVAETLAALGARPQDCWKKREPVELRWRGKRVQAMGVPR